MWPFKRRALASAASPDSTPKAKRAWKITDLMLADVGAPKAPSFELTPLVGAHAMRVDNPFEPAKGPGGKPLMAMDDAFTSVIGDLNGLGYGLGGGIGFIGYGFLAELAQRPEYRRGYETLAREMTRRFIKFTYAGEDEDPDGDEDDDQPDDTSKVDGQSVPAAGQEEAGAQPDENEAQPPQLQKSKPQSAGPGHNGGPPMGPTTKPSDEKIKKIEAEFKRLRVRDVFRRATELDGCFGRGHIYIDTGDTDKEDELKTPLLADRRKIRKGKIKRLTVVEPQWIYPQDYDTRDPLKANFYQPQSWLVFAKKVHASRIMTFVGREVPDLLKPAYSFGGLSLTQMAQPYVDNWLRTRQSVSDLIHAFTVWGVKTDMQAMLSGADDASQLIKRAELFNRARDNRGLMMIDKENEDFFNVSAPLAGLDKLQAQAQEQMASVFAIPLVVLLGITPSGLNASSDGEIRVFYDYIAAFQQHLYSHALERLLKLVQLSLFGEVDEDIGFEFLPLWQPTETDKATIRKTKMEIDTGYVNAGVLDPVEVRDTLAADKEGDYNNIDVSDVPDDPNALPPGMNPITGEIDGAPGGGGDDPNGGDAPPSSGGGEREPPPAGGSPAPVPSKPIGAKPIISKPIPAGANDAAEFREADHPRANNGQFGSGGGSSEADRLSHVALGQIHNGIKSRLDFQKTNPGRYTNKSIREYWTPQIEAMLSKTEGRSPHFQEALEKLLDLSKSSDRNALESMIDVAGKAMETEATAPATKKDRPPFSQEEIDSLPHSDAIRQPAKTWDELQAKGEEGRKQFVDALGPVTKLLKLRTDVSLPENLTDEDLDGGDNFLFVAPNKSEARAREKVEREYDGDWDRLKDMIRGSITVSSMEDLRDAVLAVEKAGLKIAAKPKDKFTKPTPEGYRDLNTLMQLPNGMYAELQFHLTPMIAAKNEAHDYYAIMQTLQRKNGMEEPDDTWSDRDTAKFNDMRTRQRELYGPAWEKATGGV